MSLIHAVGDLFYRHAHLYRHTGRINSDMKNDVATPNQKKRHKTSGADSVELIYLIISPWALPNNDFPYGRTITSIVRKRPSTANLLPVTSAEGPWKRHCRPLHSRKRSGLRTGSEVLISGLRHLREKGRHRARETQRAMRSIPPRGAHADLPRYLCVRPRESADTVPPSKPQRALARDVIRGGRPSTPAAVQE